MNIPRTALLCLCFIPLCYENAPAQVSDQASVVASCPAKPGKDIGVVKIKIDGKEMPETDGDDIGLEWTLPSGRQTVELDCGYVRKGSKSLNVPPGGWVSLPVPRTAKTCSFSQHDPNRVTCSK